MLLVVNQPLPKVSKLRIVVDILCAFYVMGLLTVLSVNVLLNRRPDKIRSIVNCTSHFKGWQVYVETLLGNAAYRVRCPLNSSHHRGRKRPKHSFLSIEIYHEFFLVTFSQAQHSYSHRDKNAPLVYIGL